MGWGLKGTRKYICISCRNFKRGFHFKHIPRCNLCGQEMTKVSNGLQIPSPKNKEAWKKIHDSLLYIKSSKTPSINELKYKYRDLKRRKKDKKISRKNNKLKG